MELSEVEDRLSGLAAESDLCSSGWVASLNEKPHDEHAAASGEISLWQRGQFTGGELYHRVGEMGDRKELWVLPNLGNDILRQSRRIW